MRVLVIFFYKEDNYIGNRMKRWNIFIFFIKILFILKIDKKDIDVLVDILEDEEFEDEG